MPRFTIVSSGQGNFEVHPFKEETRGPSGRFATLLGPNRAAKIATVLQTGQQLFKSKTDHAYEQIIREGIAGQEVDTQHAILDHLCGIRNVLCGKRGIQYNVSRVDLWKAIPKHLDLERFSRILLEVMNTHTVKPYATKNDDLQPYRANLNRILASKKGGTHRLSRSVERRAPSNFAVPLKKNIAASRDHKGAHASLRFHRGTIHSPGKTGGITQKSFASKKARRSKP